MGRVTSWEAIVRKADGPNYERDRLRPIAYEFFGHIFRDSGPDRGVYDPEGTNTS